MRCIVVLLSLFFATAAAAKSSAEYLPENAALNPAIPTPESVLGWEVGDWHVRHDQLVRYMEILAQQSPRFSMQITGHTHERRPLVLMTVTSAENQTRLESLRQRHLQSQGSEGPLVLWMGYSVHGNEASGSNASLLFAYYLAASQDPWVQTLLDNTIILIEPSINPDGLNRFASWVNSHKSKHVIDDPRNREHNEAWPRGRTNHYWYDLNRDWLLLQHPESRARIPQYHHWRPHVLTDFHEQGSNENYFFQPGVPERENPLTPKLNFELTDALAEFHAAALDRTGQLYFTEERFDDYYYGKGSTYPDINGSIGILFEQPSARGHLMDTPNGPLPFKLAVENHLTTSLSTLRGAWSLKDRLHAYQQSFDRQMNQRRSRDRNAGWLVGDDNDPTRMQAFLEILRLHQIEAAPLSKSVTTDGTEFPAGKSWFISNAQDQYGLLQALMETRTEFVDETFYDVSTWTLPLAFNLPYAAVGRAPSTGSSAAPRIAGVPDPEGLVGWALRWEDQATAAVLTTLLRAEIPVRASKVDLDLKTPQGSLRLKRGGLIVPTGRMTDAELDRAYEILRQASETHRIEVHGISTGLTATGRDLGSNKVRALEPVRPLLWVGNGVNGYEAGEIWHFLDTRIGLPPVMVEGRQLRSLPLNDYTHLIMVNGAYEAAGSKLRPKIEQWINQGGVLIATKNAAVWAESLYAPKTQKDEHEAAVDDEQQEDSQRRPYGEFENDQAQRVIGGAIVRSDIDLSHPLGFGFQRKELPLFRNGTVLLEPSENAYATVVAYHAEPLLSGFIGEDRLDEVKGQPAVIAERHGAGLIVRIANNPSFRGYWWGTQRLLANALFFSQLVDRTNLN